LRECAPDSILRSAMTAAVLNLPVDKNLGQAWIIPYREHGKPVAQFQMGYKGFVQLCHRTGQYTHLNAANIYQGMSVEEDPLTGALRVTGKKINDEVIGYAAYMRLKNGFEKAVYWTFEYMQAHARRYSKSYGRESSPWSTHPDDMGKKTVLMHLVKHWGVMSVQVQDAIVAEETNGAPKAQDLSEYIEGEYHDAQPPEEPALVVADDAQAVAIDPALILVNAGVCQNDHAARGLLKHIPEEVQQNETTLREWGRMYRGWRKAGAAVEAAAENATNGADFEQA
jgi:recombination protein RecT